MRQKACSLLTLCKPEKKGVTQKTHTPDETENGYTTFYLLLAGVINGLLTFDIARIFTGDSWSGAAGPKDMGLTSVLYIYYQGVQFRNMPVAAVMSMVLFVIIMIVTVVNYKLGDKWVSYD